MSWVLGVDSGGSGLRAALADAGDLTGHGARAGTGGPRNGSVALPYAAAASSREPVRTGSAGIDAGHLLEQLVPMARDLLERAGAGRLSAVVIGAAGMATLGGPLRAELPAALESALGVRRLVLAADAVTAYAGALGSRAGAVVAVGTGTIALGTDLTVWRRADGWGHLLGDCGSGAWIGRAGLEAGLRAHDGRRGGSAVLLDRMESVFGPASKLPGFLYPRSDRPAVLAAFAPDVARCASDDPVAAAILARAAGHIAEAAAAVCPPPDEVPDGCEVALTGGLLKLGEPLLGPLRRELAGQLPHARQVASAGDPLSGALRLAGELAAGELRLPAHPTLLHVPGGTRPGDCQDPNR
ncbi:BadF/BadG/BcrA/BcrD ATPase family protein [Streptomyces sp. NPDC048389]|uniref:N-acetylglucosamine kinase n=1 Tax=Streptomyces sp. NPDC048389 TaxID=3154622 RepID=UPI00345114A5